MPMNSFIKRFQNHIFHNCLIENGDKIVIGVSGGPDSVCLASVLVELRKKYDLQLSLFHVNYGLRGRYSDGDEKFVGELAEQLKIPLKVVNFSKKAKEGNLEEVMRDFRYAELEKERKKLGYTKVAVAHTLDDQVETFLMNLARGSGMLGLGAMPLRRDLLIRPLLFFKKDEIIEFLKRIKRSYRVDKSNFDEKFFRNKIRGKVVPFLEKQFGRTIKENIFNATLFLQQGNSYIEKVSEKSYNKAVSFAGEEAQLEVPVFLELEPVVRSYVFRKICLKVGGNIRGLELGHFSEFMKVVESKKQKRQKFVFGNIVTERRGGKVYFWKISD